MTDFWVFGYGSLMWRPGFAFEHKEPARLHGYHRAFCVYSHVHRGTPAQPGLVFGLDARGSCKGMAFRIAPDRVTEVRDYLRAREQVTMVYREEVKRVRLLHGGDTVDALCYVVDRSHEQYAGSLSFEEQVRLIVRGEGQSGRNPDYLHGMVQHLDEMGTHDEGLTKLWNAVRERLPRSG